MKSNLATEQPWHFPLSSILVPPCSARQDQPHNLQGWCKIKMQDPLLSKYYKFQDSDSRGFSKDGAPYNCTDPMSLILALLLCLSGSWILQMTFPDVFAILLLLRFSQWKAWVGWEGWEGPLEGMKEKSICILFCFLLPIDPLIQLLRFILGNNQGVGKDLAKILFITVFSVIAGHWK